MFDTEEMQNDTNFEERGILQDTHLMHGDFKMPSWPVRVDGAPPYLIQPIAILTHARGDSGFVQRISPPSGQPMLNKGGERYGDTAAPRRWGRLRAGHPNPTEPKENCGSGIPSGLTGLAHRALRRKSAARVRRQQFLSNRLFSMQ